MAQTRLRTHRPERGVVMLLALVALLLIAAVGAAILFLAYGESYLVGSQKTIARSFYGALSGLEEARARMTRGMPAPDTPGGPGVGLNPDASLGGTVAVPQAVNEVLYVLNPAPAEAIDPSNPADPYYDSQLASELGAGAGAPVFLPTQVSADPGTGTSAALPYKWVRVTMKTEYASRQDLDFSGDYNQNDLIFYYNQRQYRLADLLAWNPTVVPPAWGGPVPSNPDLVCAGISCAMPVYKVTALAALPNGTRRMTQYEVVAPPPVGVTTPLFTQGGLDINGGGSLFVSGDDNCDPNCDPAVNVNYPVGCNQLPGARTGGIVTISGNAGDSCPTPDALTGQCCSNIPADPNYDPNCVCFASGPNKGCWPLGENETFPYNIQDIVQQLFPFSRPATEVVSQYGGNLKKSSGEWSGQKVGLGTLPTPWVPPVGTMPTGNIPEITYFDATTHITASGSQGSGILIVDGDLEINGGFEFYGLIIVTGTVTFSGGGAAIKNIIGSIIAGGGVNASSVGGSFDLSFDSCSVSKQFRDLPLLVLAFREVT